MFLFVNQAFAFLSFKMEGDSKTSRKQLIYKRGINQPVLPIVNIHNPVREFYLWREDKKREKYLKPKPVLYREIVRKDFDKPLRVSVF